MHQRSMITIAAAAVLAIAAVSTAQQPPPPAEIGDPCVAAAAQQRIASFLELTDDQLTGWDVLIDDRELAAEPVRAAIAAVQLELDELLDGDDPDPLEVGLLVIQRHDLGHELADIQRVYVDGFGALLDDEQLARYRFIRRAERAEPLFPAFRVLDLLPPHWR